ncbi:MAG TPA: hypothetical protein PKE30_00135 [Niabella sp.]|nr:hypothetical protein [Niabella sp.]
MKVNKNYAAYLAALWSFLFGVVHFIWAADFYWGLPKEPAKQAFEKDWFYIYNLVAGMLFLFAAGLAMLLGSNTTKWKRSVIVCGWCCTMVLIFRGTAAVILWLYFIITPHSGYSSISIWDIWFLTGGLLFLLSVLRFQRLCSTRNYKL